MGRIVGIQKRTAPTAIGAISYEPFDLLPDLICITHQDGADDYFNRAWRDFCPGVSDRFLSDDWIKWVIPLDRGNAERALTAFAASRLPQEVDIRLRHPVRGDRWYLLRLSMRGGGADPVGIRILTDIHERKIREQGLSQTANIRAEMLNVSVDCIKVINADGTLAHMNKAGCEALNVEAGSGFGMEWLGLLPPEAREPGLAALEEASMGRNARFLGVSRLQGQDSCYWDNMLTPLINARREVEAILCVSRDVTIQRESERRIALLLHELNHRSKNTLSVILALIRRTVPDPQADYVTVIHQRISAIARGQDLLIHGAWVGATVTEVVSSQTAVAGDVHEKRLILDGDQHLRFLPETAEKIGLAIHELTTNAIKHGALSTDVGTVTINWFVQEGPAGPIFGLRWKETGGVEVQTPTHRGFGTVVIERNPLAVRGSSVAYSYEPDGVVWEFRAPESSALSLG